MRPDRTEFRFPKILASDWRKNVPEEALTVEKSPVTLVDLRRRIASSALCIARISN